jgi:hypothetical protein
MDQEVEIMRISRVPPRGALAVYVGDVLCSNLTDIVDPLARQRVIAAIGELVGYAGGYGKLVAEGVAPENGHPELTAGQPVSLAGVTIPTSAPILTGEGAALVAVAIEGRSDSWPSTPKQVSSLSLVEQINEILKQHIAQTEELRGHHLQWATDTSGGLQVIADGKIYARPADIPDPKIKAVIYSALREWDAR